MFTVGMSDLTRVYFSCATLVIGVPTAVKIFAWSLALSETNFRDWTFVLVATFLSCFVFGGFTGLLLANAAIDLAYHDTYFVIGHFHYVLSIAAAIGLSLFLLNAICSLLNVILNASLIVVVLLLGIAGVNAMFLILHLIGIEGHPRRIFLSPETCTGLASFANSGLWSVLVALLAIPGLAFAWSEVLASRNTAPSHHGPLEHR